MVCGVSFAVVQWFSSNYLSPMLPDILSSLTSMIALVLFLRVWQPKSICSLKTNRSSTGTAILIAGLTTAFILRIKAAELYRIFADTLKNLRFALLTIALVLGFSYVANWSGMTPTLGKAFTVTGTFFPFLSAFLGWLGVFITGSDTSSNALFARMQQVTAQSTGINPVLTVAASSSGGVMGKMIPPRLKRI